MRTFTDKLKEVDGAIIRTEKTNKLKKEIIVGEIKLLREANRSLRGQTEQPLKVFDMTPNSWKLEYGNFIGKDVATTIQTLFEKDFLMTMILKMKYQIVT